MKTREKKLLKNLANCRQKRNASVVRWVGRIFVMTLQDWYHIGMSKTLWDVPTKEYRVKYKGKVKRDQWATKHEVFIIFDPRGLG